MMASNTTTPRTPAMIAGSSLAWSQLRNALTMFSDTGRESPNKALRQIRALGEGADKSAKEMAPPGPFQSKIRSDLVVVVMTLLDDHHPVAAMTPAMVPAAIAMLAVLGAGAVTVMIAITLDHHGLCAGDRRRGDSDGDERPD